MKGLLTSMMIVLGSLVLADEAAFIHAYDVRDFSEAARLSEAELDVANPEVARRLGVMYHEGKGFPQNPAKGCELLEQAMSAGDVTAALNLVKIYYHADMSKAAWCLMVASSLDDGVKKSDIVRFREMLGEDWVKRAVTYTFSLRGALAIEIDKGEDFRRERADLAEQLAKEQEESERKSAEYVQNLEKMRAANSQLESENARLEKEILSLKTANTDLGKKVPLLKSANEGLEKEVSALKTARDDLKAKLSELKTSYTSLEEQISSRDAANVKLQEEVSLLNTLKSELAKRLAKSEGAVRILNERIAALNERGLAIPPDSSETYRKYREMCIRYNRLVDKYNLLVRRYNALGCGIETKER